MRCPHCQGKTVVADSRENDKGVHRRRRCGSCGTRFSTRETVHAIVRPQKLLSVDEEVAHILDKNQRRIDARRELQERREFPDLYGDHHG